MVTAASPRSTTSLLAAILSIAVRILRFPFPAEGNIYRRVFYRLFAVFLAGPAALGLVGRLSDRLDLSAVLAKAIRHYEDIVYALGQKVHDVIPWFSPSHAEIVAIAILFLASTIIQRKTLNRGTYTAEEREILKSASLCSCFLIIVIFIANPDTSVYQLMVFGLIYVLISYYPRTGLYVFAIIYFLVTTSLTFVIFFTDPAIPLEITLATIRRGASTVWITILNVGTLILVARLILRGSAGPLNMLLISSSILLIDWIARVPLTQFDQWLDTLQAR